MYSHIKNQKKKTFIFDISKVNNILEAAIKNMVECS